MPVSLTVLPVLRVNALIVFSSLSTPHCTVLTLDKFYSPRSGFRGDGVILIIFRTEPKLLVVS